MLREVCNTRIMIQWVKQVQNAHKKYTVGEELPSKKNIGFNILFTYNLQLFYLKKRNTISVTF